MPPNIAQNPAESPAPWREGEINPERHRDVNIGLGERVCSAVSGALLAAAGLSRGSIGGAILALIGGGIFYRGLTGHSRVYDALGVRPDDAAPGAGPFARHVYVRNSVTINKPPEELYRFWREVENLPRFMRQVRSVRAIDEARSHWVARMPANAPIEWDAQITEDRENERIAWRTIDGTPFDHAGWVEFRRAAGGRGTRVTVEMSYHPPGGVFGAAVSKFFTQDPQREAAEDLRRFKQLMEAGEIATAEGPSGRQRPGEAARLGRAPAPGMPRPAAGTPIDRVTEASEESFPASDAPSFTPTQHP